MAALRKPGMMGPMRREVTTVEELRAIVRVEEFFHCARAFLRSGAWNPESWTPDAVPSVAQLAKTFKPDLTQAELDEYYSPDNMAKQLY